MGVVTFPLVYNKCITFAPGPVRSTLHASFTFSCIHLRWVSSEEQIAAWLTSTLRSSYFYPSLESEFTYGKARPAVQVSSGHADRETERSLQQGLISFDYSKY